MAKPRKSKGGRKKLPGERDAKGRLIPHIPPNDRVIELRAKFAIFHGGKADQQIFDPIGRAWTCGLLDGFDVDPAAIRDAGRNYGNRYWSYYHTVAGTANYEGEDRRGGGGGCYTDPDPRGEKFEAIDRALLDAGRQSYNAMQQLCVDHHWFPETNPHWLERLINGKRAAMDRPVSGELPRAGDADILRSAVEALLAIVQGQRRAA